MTKLTLFELGSFAVSDATDKSDGVPFRSVRFAFTAAVGRPVRYTQLDASEVKQLRDALTQWLNGRESQ